MHMLLVLKPQLNHVPLMLKTTTTTSACFPDLKTCNTMPALLVLKTQKTDGHAGVAGVTIFTIKKKMLKASQLNHE